MLAIDQRLAIGGFAGLKEIGTPLSPFNKGSSEPIKFSPIVPPPVSRRAMSMYMESLKSWGETLLLPGST